MRRLAVVAGLAAGLVPGVAMADTAMTTALLSATSSAQTMAFGWAAESWPIIAVIVAGGILVTFFAIIRGS